MLIVRQRIKLNKMRFFYCFRGKSILSIMQQNPVKAQDSSQYNIQISEEHKDFISKSGFECDSSHKQSQSQEKNDQFKNECPFLGEGQIFSRGV